MTTYEPVVACCELCGSDIYGGEGYYFINGETICDDCLAEFARSYLRPYLTGEEA